MRFRINGLLSVLAAGAALTIGAGQSHAASYSVFTGGDPGEGLDFQGTFPAAINMAKNIGDEAGAVIGGAAFENITGVAGGDPVNQPPGVFTGGSTTGNFYNSDLGVGFPNYGATTADNTLEGLMNSTWATDFTVSFSVGAPGSGSRLITGQPYKMQMFGLAGNVGANRPLQLFVEGEDQGTFNFIAPTSFDTGGGVITHEFTAVDTFLSDGIYSFAAIFPGGQNNAPFIGGMTIEAIPEPASMSLLGLGGLGLLRRRHA